MLTTVASPVREWARQNGYDVSSHGRIHDTMPRHGSAGLAAAIPGDWKLEPNWPQPPGCRRPGWVSCRTHGSGCGRGSTSIGVGHAPALELTEGHIAPIGSHRSRPTGPLRPCPGGSWMTSGRWLGLELGSRKGLHATRRSLVGRVR
ncbi:Lsr2 family DNA-binding protein [Nocardia sp. GAS34]|uniref:Lsr2 family DNA-binding protein n=1 Tax=Nocardia sp. GAS34 TaxID=3156305 RepID=UPI003D23193C